MDIFHPVTAVVATEATAQFHSSLWKIPPSLERYISRGFISDSFLTKIFFFLFPLVDSGKGTRCRCWMKVSHGRTSKPLHTQKITQEQHRIPSRAPEFTPAIKEQRT